MTDLTAILLAFMTFAAVTVLVLTLVGARQTPTLNRLRGYGNSSQVATADKLSLPFTSRVMLPVLAAVAQIGRSLSAKQIEEQTRIQLAQAGNPAGIDVTRFLALRVFGLLAPPLILIGPGLLFGTASLTTAAIAMVVAAVGWRAPSIWVDSRISARRKIITRSLPDALDLIIVCVEAGNSLEGALAIVSQRTTGPLADELERTLREMSLGKARLVALRDLAERAASPDLRTFIAAVIQADQLGVGIAQVLRVQGEAMRVRRRQRAEEQAARVPVLMLIPLVLFILPALMIIIMGPIALTVIAFLSKGGGGL